MNTKTVTSFVVGGLVVWIVSGCQSVTTLEPGKVGAANYAGVPAAEYKIGVSGTEGMKFAGTIVTDGVKKEVSGVVPQSYQVTGHEVVCNLKKQEEKGDLVLKVWEGDHNVGSCSTDDSKSMVRGWVLRAKDVQHYMFTTVNEGK
jgi:hypothetical protein